MAQRTHLCYCMAHRGHIYATVWLRGHTHPCCMTYRRITSMLYDLQRVNIHVVWPTEGTHPCYMTYRGLTSMLYDLQRAHIHVIWPTEGTHPCCMTYRRDTSMLYDLHRAHMHAVVTSASMQPNNMSITWTNTAQCFETTWRQYGSICCSRQLCEVAS